MLKSFRRRTGTVPDLAKTVPAKKQASAARSQPIRALEPRFVFDGAAVHAAADAAQAAAPAAEAAQPASAPESHPHSEPGLAPATDQRAAGQAPVEGGTQADARVEIVVIDRNLPDLQVLLQGVPDTAEVLLIESGRDGVAQLADALRGRSDIDAVHILSHGREGELRLGTALLTSATIEGRYADDLATIGRALSTDADLLIYGCDFAAGAEGREATRLLAHATGADVAGSDDATGHADLGGDWDLEVRAGEIETGIAVDAGARAEWHRLLAPVTISVTGDPTVRDGSGAAINTSTASNGVNYFAVNANIVGADATWSNVGTVGGVAVSLRATVVSIGSGDGVSFGRSGDDAAILVRSTNTASPPNSDGGRVTLRWDLVRTDDPTIAVTGDIAFQIGDIDGIGAPDTRESVTASQTGLTSYTLATTTNLVASTSNDLVKISGTGNENASPPDSVANARFNWTNISSWQLTYDLHANATTGQAAFIHDGDLDLVITDPVTTPVPKVDLDGDDSSGAIGNDYRATFTRNGTAVAVADTDVLITNTAGTLSSATVVLTNAQTGDELLVGTLPSGIGFARDTSVPGIVTITLSGGASAADYHTALRAVTFRNTATSPDLTDRAIDTRIGSGGVMGTSARTTVAVTANTAPVAAGDSVITIEDNPIAFDVRANDSDANGDALSVSQIDGTAIATGGTVAVTNGSVTLGSDGRLTFSPAKDYFGPASFTYTIRDPMGATATATVNLTVTAVDDPPQSIVPVPQATDEDTSLVFSTANGNAISIQDVDGGAQTVSLSATKGVLTLSRTTGLTFAVGDGTGDGAMTFSGTTTAINAALEGLVYRPDDNDNGAAQLTIRTTSSAAGFVNGGFENPGYPGTTFRIVDQGEIPGWRTTASTGNIEIWDSGYNGVPAYEGNQFAEINADATGALYQDFQSVAGSRLDVAFAHRGRAGTDVMSVTVTDLGANGTLGGGDDIVLLSENFSDGNAAWGAYARLVDDTASGNRVRFAFGSISTASGSPTSGSFVDGIAITQSVRAQDVVPLTIIPVNDAPDNAVPGAQSVAEDTDLVFSGANAITVSDIDAGSGTLTTTLSVGNGALTLGSTAGLSSVGGNGTASVTLTGTVAQINAALDGTAYRSAANYNGPVTLTVATSDSGNTGAGGALTDTDTDTVAITVTAVNDAPVAAADSTTTAEDTPVTLDVRGNDTDVDAGDTLTVFQIDGTAIAPGGSVAVANGSVRLEADGRLTFTPAANYAGSASFTYTVRDAANATATATVSVTAITSVNDAPVNAVPGGQSVAEDTDLVFSTANGNAITVSDVDAAAGALTTTLTVGSGTLTLGSTAGLTGVSGNATASVTLTGTVAQINAALDGTLHRGAANANGPVTLTVTTSDNGNTGAGGPLADADTVAITVTPVDDAPSARDDAAATSEDTPVTLDVRLNDADVEGGPLVVSAIDGTAITTGGSVAVTNGSVRLEADGRLTFTPAPNYVGAASFAYTVRDGANATAIAAVTITAITPVNDAPANAVPGARTVAEDTDLVFSTATGNAITVSDVDAAAGDLTTTLTVGNGTLTLGSTAGLTGVSGNGTASVTLTGTATRINAALNGTIYRGAADGTGPVTLTVTTSDNGNTGAGGPLTDADTVAITVTPVDDAPTARDDAVATSEDTPVTLDVRLNDTDVEGGPLVVSAIDGMAIASGQSAAVANGTVTLQGDGRLTFTPAPDYTGPASFAYTVRDPNGGTATATVRVTAITPVNDAPVHGLPGAQTMSEDGSLVFAAARGNAITVADVDAGAGVLTTVISVGNGTLTLGSVAGASASGDGTGRVTLTGTLAGIDAALDGLTYRPAPNYNGPVLIAVTTNDNGNSGSGGARSDADAITVAVTPVNDPPVEGSFQPITANDGETVALDFGGASDLEGDRLTYAIGGLPPGLGFDPATGIVTGRIDPSASRGGTGGVYAVSVTALDGNGGATTRVFAWTILNPAPLARDDAIPASEDGAIAGSVFADHGAGPDSDPDGDAVAVVAVNGASANVSQAIAGTRGGTFTLGADGSYRFDPGLDFRGLRAGSSRDTGITYTIADGDGGLSTARVTVTVIGTNAAPDAGALGNQVDGDGQAIALNLTPFFADSDGDALAYAATGLPPGLTIDPATGLIAGRIASDASGSSGANTYRVVLTARDPSGAAVVRGFDWRVTNPPPTAIDDAAALAEDGTVSIDVRANDSDPDGDTLTIVASGPDAPAAGHGRVTVANGRLAYTPDANFNGTDTILYTIADGNGGFSTAIVSVSVTPVNDAPTALVLPAAYNRDGQTLSYPVAAFFRDSDADPRVAQGASGGALTYAATGLPPGLAIDPATGVISGTLASNASATPAYVVTVTATDSGGLAVNRAFIWTITNDGPVAGADVAATAEGTAVQAFVTVNDTDPDGDSFALVGDPGTYAAGHGSVAVDPATGTITYSPDPGFNGVDAVTYTLRDAQGSLGTGILTVTVVPANDRPLSAAVPGLNSLDGQSVALALQPFFSDPDRNVLTFSATALPPGLSIDPATGLIAGTIDRGASGPTGRSTYTVTVTARDRADVQALSVARTFTWTIVDPAPIAADDAATTREDVAIDLDVVKAAAADGTPGRDTDPDRDDLVVVPGSLSAGHGTVSLNPDGTLRYVPEAHFNGIDTILYRITDGNGGESTASVAVTVVPVNDAPTARALPDRTGLDGDRVDIDAGPFFDDADSGDGAPLAAPDALTFSADGLPPGLSIDARTGRITGLLVGDASSRVPGGAYAVTVTARDRIGESVSSSFVWTVANPTPAARNDAFGLREDGAITGTVLDNDMDSDGDALSVDPTPVRGPDHGTLTLRADGTFTYVPDAEYFGPDSFVYTLRDADGRSATATVTLSVASVLDPPVANADAILTPEDVPVTIDVLGNDRSPEGFPLVVTGASVDPATGRVVINRDGTLTFTPARNYFGLALIDYTVSDGRGGSARATVTVAVAPVNDAPVASAAPLSVTGNAGKAGEVIAADADADPLTFTLRTGPRNGTIVLNPDGTYLYRPFPGFNGEDVFQVAVDDGQGGVTLVDVPVTVLSDPIELRPSPAPALLQPDPSPSPRGYTAFQEPAIQITTTTGFVLVAVDQISRLDSVANVVLADGAVIAAVNGVTPLGGNGDISGGRAPIQNVADQIERISIARLEANREISQPWFDARPYLGRSLEFSLGDEAPGAGSLRGVTMEAIRRTDSLVVNIRALGLAATSEIVDIRMRSADGQPAPAWLERSARGVFVGRPPAGTERIELELEFVMRDGSILRKPVTIDVETGEVRALPKLRETFETRLPASDTQSSVAEFKTNARSHLSADSSRTV